MRFRRLWIVFALLLLLGGLVLVDLWLWTMPDG